MTSAETSLVSRTFKSRLRSDPSLGIADLMRPFNKMLEHCNSRDIQKVLDAPPEMDWKSSPSVKWLCRQQVLFKSLLEIAPNTVVTSRKMKDALQRLQDEEPINLTKRDDAVLWDYVDTKVRIGLAQLRELKNNRDYCLDRAMRKLSDPERDVLRTMLDMIHFNADDSTTTTTTPPSAGRHNKEVEDKQQTDNSLALVPALTSNDGSDRRHRQQQASSASATDQPFAFHAVFDNILQKNSPPHNTGGTKKQAQLEEGFMASQSSEATTPEKSRHHGPAKRKLSFSDADGDQQQHGEQANKKRKEPTITILPAGQKIVEEKKRKGTTRIKREENEEQVRKSRNIGGLFDSLLDSLGDDEEIASENDKSSQLPASSSSIVNKGNRVSSPKKRVTGKKKEDEEQDPAGILDSVSRLWLLYLFDDCQFLFAFLESVMFRWCLLSKVLSVIKVRFIRNKCCLF